MRCNALQFSRVLCWLSALQTTLLSPAFVEGRRRGCALPSEGTIHKSDICSFSSYAGSMTEKTTSLPSGESDGAPTRGINHSASWVTGCFVCAYADAAPQQRHATINTTRLINEFVFTVRSPSMQVQTRPSAHWRSYACIPLYSKSQLTHAATAKDTPASGPRKVCVSGGGLRETRTNIARFGSFRLF